MNRSIQAEGTFGVIKEDHGFRRFLHLKKEAATKWLKIILQQPLLYFFCFIKIIFNQIIEIKLYLFFNNKSHIFKGLLQSSSNKNIPIPWSIGRILFNSSKSSIVKLFIEVPIKSLNK